ncbi:MAG: SIMPL domain-containing protein [Lachnospiraceae bacterium]|nr:SIMPL domain-containing protein [Lachnospiraceae bacterium]
MKEWKGIVIALVAGICAIACAGILVMGFLSYKQSSGENGIVATGSANCDFESDLIVWRGSFSAYGQTTMEAYDVIKRDSKLIKEYLEKNNITEDEMVFNSVNISKRYTTRYNEAGDVMGDYPDGYDLYQEVCVTSNDVDKVEKISRDITELIESGVEFTSNAPEYYYTKLDELKLQLIEDATQNAKERVDIMAKATGEAPGKLVDANLGIFQITAKNSAEEEYSYGGTFNTSSRDKTATITVKLNYTVK